MMIDLREVMMRWIKNNWLVLLVFGAVFSIFMIDLNPDMTFMCKAADSVGYLYSAKYLYPSYHTSPPLYLLTSHLFLKIPFGTDAWRMGLVSVFSSMGACVFIYLIIKMMIFDRWLKRDNRKNISNWVKKRKLTSTPYKEREKAEKSAMIFALLGVLIYGTSAIVICQTVVVQTYATVCMLASGAFYFSLKKQWKLVGLMLGAGLAVHLLMGFVMLILVAVYRGANNGHWNLRQNWKALAIMLSFLAFYAYIPLTNRPPYMWFPAPEQVNPVWAFITDTISTIDFVVGSLAIWDFPKRILDTLGIMFVSIAGITIVPIAYYFKNNKVIKNPLFWLASFPIILFATELDMNTYDYMMVSIPFLAIIICLGLSDMVHKYWNIEIPKTLGEMAKKYYKTPELKKMVWTGILVALTWASVIGFGIFNLNYFDIGRTCDPNMSTARLYYQEFAKIPDGAIFMPNYAMEWEAIYKYNADYGKHIYPICMDILPSQNYRDQLRKDGIKFVDSTNPNYSIMGRETAQSIVLMNDNVWTTVATIPETLQTDVVPANGNISLIEILTEEQLKEIADNPKWLWKPWNPYHIMTNSVSMLEWRNQLLSSFNVRLFVCLGAAGWILMWGIEKLKKRRLKDEDSVSAEEG